MLTIAVTGHRKLLNKDDVRRAIALSLAYFKEQDPSIKALSALATGADTIFAQEALEAGASLRVMLPFALFDYQQDFTEAEQAELEELLKKCDQPYEVVAPLKTNTAEERNEAYLATGKKMVDEADVLLAVWDGQPADGKGGTGDIVQYAKEQGKKVHIIKGIRFDKKLNSIFYPSFDKLDKEALTKKFLFHKLFWLGGIGAGLIAVLIFAISMSFSNCPHPDRKGLLLPILETFFVFLSYWFLGKLASKQKSEFLKKRNWTEYLRAHFLMEECGFEIVTDKQFHPDYKISDEIRDLEVSYNLSQKETLALQSIKTEMANFVTSQNKYHTDVRINGYKKVENRIEIALKSILWGFAIIIAAKLVFEVMEFKANHFIEENNYLLALCKFFIILLPPAYAALEGIFYFSDWKRNIDISKAVNNQYNDLLQEINSSQSIDHLTKLAVDLNHIYWDEQYNWLEWYHNKKIEARV